MKALKTLLVPVDGSWPANRAFHAAVSLAMSAKAFLYILYAISPDDVDDVHQDQYETMEDEISPTAGKAREEADKVIKDLEKDIPDDLQYKALIVMGYPEKAIAHFSSTHPIDLIVMGNSGKGSVSSFVTGSVSYYTIHHCKEPVLIVK
jgi:nucleotide-binding universal stress UspA family protein